MTLYDVGTEDTQPWPCWLCDHKTTRFVEGYSWDLSFAVSKTKMIILFSWNSKAFEDLMYSRVSETADLRFISHQSVPQSNCCLLYRQVPKGR